MTDTPHQPGSAPAGRDPYAPPGSARWHLASHLRLWPVAVLGLAADLWTKQWAFSSLPPDGEVVIPWLMSFHRSLNTGALFGLGKGLTPVFIAASFLALAFVLFLFVHSSRDRRSLHVALALVLGGALGNLHDRSFAIADVVTFTVDGRSQSIVGSVIDADSPRGVLVGSWPDGAHPQLVRREWAPSIRSQGVVRDFIRMEPKLTIGERTIHVWPWVFNIADVLLVAGVGLLMLNFYWERRDERAQAAAHTQASPDVQ
jgi:lipoprotein signal peptidase